MNTTEVAFPLGRALRVLEHRARLTDFATWEQARVELVLNRIYESERWPPEVVFDIGAEEGEYGALYAREGASVHLFEPTPSVWPNVRAVFEANDVRHDGAFCGFVGDFTRNFDAGFSSKFWPSSAHGPIQPDGRFSVLVERPDFPCVTVDDYVERTGAIPTMLLVDVEGAEVAVLRGALKTLKTHRPRVIVSIHPPTFLRRMTPNKEEHESDQQEHVFRLLDACDYLPHFLAHDHEAHWAFDPT